MIYIALIPGVSKLIDSVISKRQGNQRKHSFLEQSTRQFHNFFSYLKMFRIQCRKNIAAEDNKKNNEYSLLYKYIYKYIYLYYM